MLPARNLTFEFEPVVVGTGTDPEEWQIVLTPLASPLDGTIPSAQLVGERQSQSFVMGTNVVFQVVPSDAPGLNGVTTWYRVGWRPRFFGKLTSFDFTMPDEDLTFSQLQDLGQVLGDSVYLRQSDLGVHVAPIDDQGFVLDGNGDRIGAGTVVESEMSDERTARIAGDAAVTTNFQSQLSASVEGVLATATARINAAVAMLNSADLTEFGARTAAVAALNASISDVSSDLNASLTALSGQVSANTTTLGLKADLVDGKIATSQIPTLSLTTAVAVADQTHMLALTDDQVQPGDLAVRPDGTFLLLTTPISTLANWIMLSTGGGVQAVNGQEGVVHLAAADVGAIAIGAMLPQTQITGLGSALAAKANQTDLTTLAATVAGITGDTTIVRSSAGLIAKSLMPIDAVFVDTNGLLRKKDGTLIAGQGGSGGPVDWSEVVNTPTTFPPTIGSTSSTAVAGNDSRLTDSRTPTAHATSHGHAGSDPVTLTTAQITGLDTTLSGYGNRINTLEDAGGGGGGSGPPVQAVWFSGSEVTGITDPAVFQTDMVLQKGPFGQSASDSTYYYNPAGADNDEWRWPVLTPNGHLKLVKWDETAPADPTYATETDITTVNTAIALKADASALTALSGTVATKALQTDMTAAQAAIALKANASDLTTTNATVATKANSSDLATTNATAAALATTVAGKVDTSFLTTNYANNTTLTGVLAAKADLVSGALKASQIPTGIPQTSIASLATTFSGKVDNTYLAANYTTTTAMNTLLSTKADLVGGKLSSSQLPSIATTEIQVVQTMAQMLALTTTQVQQGDICVITGVGDPNPSDPGTYILSTNDPSQQANWVELVNSTSSGVTGIFSAASGTLLVGNVSLSAADVNARSASVLIGTSDLSATLNNTINAKANASDLAAKTGPADVTNLMISQSVAKLTVRAVATANISLTGTPVLDGVALNVGDRVLATAQTSRINNGIYVVSNSGTWLRSADMAGPNSSGVGPAGVEIIVGTLVIVTNGTTVTNGITNANSVWMCTGDASGNSGVVGVSLNNWVMALKAGPPPVYTAANNSGLTIDNTNPSAPALAVKNTTGIAITTAGVGVDHTKVPFVARGLVPSNGIITHGLGQTDVSVTLYVNDSTNTMAGLLGWQSSTDGNQVTLEFGTPPATGALRYVIVG